jgi:hypothetical protein
MKIIWAIDRCTTPSRYEVPVDIDGDLIRTMAHLICDVHQRFPLLNEVARKRVAQIMDSAVRSSAFSRIRVNARAGPNAIRGVTFIVRSERAGTEGLLNQIRQAVWSVNSNLPASPRRCRSS